MMQLCRLFVGYQPFLLTSLYACNVLSYSQLLWPVIFAFPELRMRSSGIWLEWVVAYTNRHSTDTARLFQYYSI
jgi:hypothetical protein